MKIKTLLIGASVLGLASAAHAQNVVNITGATAFRAAAHAAIVAGFTGNLTVGTTGSNNSVNSHSMVIYKGTFTGRPGVTTIIRTSWTGSVEGIRSLADAKNPKLNATRFIAANATFSGTAAAPTLNMSATDTLTVTKGLVADLAFSDCNVSSTPYAKKAAILHGASAGIIPFLPCVNKDSNVGITNLTTHQLREIHKEGKVPLSRFTGVSTDTADVYNVQRYDGSGTRVITLAEGGYGAANLTKGYAFPTSNGLGNGSLTLSTTPELVIASATATDYAKYGQSSGINRVSLSSDYYPAFSANHTGNGGYVSGGSIADLMKLSGSVNIISCLGTGDANRVYNSGSNGGRIISFNGERLDGFATTGALTTADKDKIRYGKYTLWSTQMLYSVGAPAANTAKKAVYDALISLTDAELGANGVATSTMQVNRTLASGKGATIDGGAIRP